MQKSSYSGVCESVLGGDWRDPSGEEKTATNPKDKLKRITTAMKKVMIQDAESSDSGDDDEIIKQLKEKFHTTAERSEKVRVLTVLPKS